jgi:hypothetical protein
VAAPVNASNVEFTVNTGSNKSSFSKDWPDKRATRTERTDVAWAIEDRYAALIPRPDLCLAPEVRVQKHHSGETPSTETT